MKINEIISENFSGAFASVAMPMTPGTKKKDAKRSVYGEVKKQKKYKMGYSDTAGNIVYDTPVKSQMIKR